MSGTRGPLSKPEDQRVRRNLPDPSRQITTLVWDGQQRGPDLPEGVPGVKWTRQTILWWNVWRNSPQAMVMTDTDWAIMMEIALLVNDLWTPVKEPYRTPSGRTAHRIVRRSTTELTKLRAEIRQSLAAFGASFEDRQRRGLKIATDNDQVQLNLQAKADAAQVVNYAEMLTQYAAKLKRSPDDKEG